MRQLPQLPVLQPKHVPFGGGLDLVTPSIRAKPGSLRLAQNFELDINNGYRVCKGYERFDGRPSPSDAVHYLMECTFTAPGSISVGDIIDGDPSGAQGVVIAVADDESYIIMTKVTGTWADTDEIDIATVKVGDVDVVPANSGGSTADLRAQYKNLAADEYRGDISGPGGSGATLGGQVLNDVLYVWQADGAGNADLYKSSASGFTQVALGRELSFTSGSSEIAVGDVIDGITSSASVTVTGVTVESGSWASGDAAGRLIFASQTGTFQAEALEFTGVGVDIATIAGDSTAITMDDGGTFEMIVENFGGQSGTAKIYGCDGVNRGFEFDGTTFIPISTGMTTDAPTHVMAHKLHLFFSFGASAQHSAIGDPYNFTVIEGAGELALGDDITGFDVQPGADGSDRLAIFSKNRVFILYGTSSADWNLIKYRKEIGAKAGTIENIGGQSIFYDTVGVRNLTATQELGNLAHVTLSELVHPFILARKTQDVTSCIVRDKNQYRVFFGDSYGLSFTFHNNKVVGIMPMLYTDPVSWVTSVELSDNTEAIYFGSTDGLVYQMERGTSFDGEEIESFLYTHFLHMGSPRVMSCFHNASFEVTGAGFSTFNFSYELGYGTTEKAQSSSEATDISFSDVFWDQFIWDAFFWDGQTITPSRHKMRGRGENVSLIIRITSDYYIPLTFSGALLMTTPAATLR